MKVRVVMEAEVSDLERFDTRHDPYGEGLENVGFLVRHLYLDQMGKLMKQMVEERDENPAIQKRKIAYHKEDVELSKRLVESMKLTVIKE